MNERIKELMLESGYAAPEFAGRAQNLAVLILKECLSYMNDANGDIDYVKFLIKRNFGVEK